MNSAISYDSKSYLVDGKRTFIYSAAVHYFRLPREEWRETLMKAKLAGMNCIDTYFAWNLHEAREGSWDFAGDKDCGAFLRLCVELGLWVIARPGPYICAEWDLGGFPWWLGRKEGIAYRQYNEIFLRYVDAYFDRIIPIIAKYQHSAGGPVILVQVENEYGHIGSDEEGCVYLNYLRDGLLRRGIDVPLISCAGGVEGTVEGANFWSNADRHIAKLRLKQPDCPKIVTEFWTGSYEQWGYPKVIQKTAPLLEKRTMEIIRAGFVGISQYMFFGGTNFADWGGRTIGSSGIFMTTSYDYDAPLNEYGRPTPKYYTTKNLGYFMQTVAPLLMKAQESEDQIQCSPKCKVRQRSASGQTIYFVESLDEERGVFHFTPASGMTLKAYANPGQIVPVTVDFRIAPGLSMNYNSFFAGFELEYGMLTLAVWADRGQKSDLKLAFTHPVTLLGCLRDMYEISGDRRTVCFDLFHTQEPQLITVGSAASELQLRILVLDAETMNRTWLLDSERGRRWLVGCDDLDVGKDGALKMTHTRPDGLVKLIGATAAPSAAWRYNSIQGCFEKPFQAGVTALSVPALADWQTAVEPLDADIADKAAAAAGSAAANTAGSATGTEASNGSAITKVAAARSFQRPVDFTSFGQGGGYLLYSTEIDCVEAGSATMVLSSLQDPARVYLNGKEISLICDLYTTSVDLPLQRGCNRLQLLVQNMGRYNYSHFLGEPKGLSGSVYLSGRAIDLRRDWQMEDGGIVHLNEVASLADSPNIENRFDNNCFDKAFLTGAISKQIRINGRPVDLDKYNPYFRYNSVDISDLLAQGENRVELAYFTSPIEKLIVFLCRSDRELTNWRIRSVMDAEAARTWSGLPFGNGLDGKPSWFRCRFPRPVVPADRSPKLKLRMTGMSKGSIWLNGVHLGRFWQVGPQEDYKLPMAWLKADNELLIFDEAGRRPDRVRLMWEECSTGAFHTS